MSHLLQGIGHVVQQFAPVIGFAVGVGLAAETGGTSLTLLGAMEAGAAGYSAGEAVQSYSTNHNLGQAAPYIVGAALGGYGAYSSISDAAAANDAATLGGSAATGSGTTAAAAGAGSVGTGAAAVSPAAEYTNGLGAVANSGASGAGALSSGINAGLPTATQAVGTTMAVPAVGSSMAAPTMTAPTQGAPATAAPTQTATPASGTPGAPAAQQPSMLDQVGSALKTGVSDFAHVAVPTLKGIQALSPIISGVLSQQMAAQQQQQLTQMSGASPQYAQQLKSLMANPNSITQTTEYQQMLATGEQQIRREMAARGMTDSGTADAAIAQYAAQLQYQMYNQQVATLSKLAQTSVQNTSLANNVMNQGNQQLFKGLGQSASNLVGTPTSGGILS